jgi:drug/metabolite transporter (DMT)-like permease
MLLLRTRGLTKPPLFWTVVTGLLMVTISLEGISEGVARAGPGNAAILINTSPFFVILLGWLFLRERMSWIGIAGVTIGFGGVIVMVSSQLGGADDRTQLVLGMAAALIGAISWAVGTLIVKWLAERNPALDMVRLTTGQFLVGGGALLVIAFAVYGTSGTDWGSGDLWGAIAWVVVGSSAIGTLTYFLALRHLSAARVSAWQFLIPAVAVVVEIVYGNTPPATVLAGMAIATIGVAVVSVAPSPAPSAALQPELEARDAAAG